MNLGEEKPPNAPELEGLKIQWTGHDHPTATQILLVSAADVLNFPPPLKSNGAITQGLAYHPRARSSSTLRSHFIAFPF